MTACLDRVRTSPSIGALEKALVESQRVYGENGNRISSKDVQLADSVRRFIDANLADPGLCPDSLADQFKLSKSSLRSIFKLVCRQNLSAYITERRLETSKQLLLETRFTVQEISTAVGISNYNSFFLFFRKATGLTPRDFRMTHQPMA